MDSPTREPGLEDGREIPLESSDGWPDLKGIHIMLIEDNDDTRLMVDEVLRHCGAVVTTYESAEVALQHLSEFVPKVFICDLSMPGLDVGGMSGFDNAKVDTEFFPNGRVKSNFLCNVGHGDPSKVMQKLPRLDFDEACTLL